MSARAREIALVLIAISVFFLGTHWSSLPPRVLAPADQLERFAPFNEQPGSDGVKNVLLLDPILQFAPWLAHTRQALAAGRLPTWNPGPGLGTVHLANDQSAVFSPFSWPVYLFGAYGLFLAGWAKSIVLALGVFLFLRRQRLSPRAAALGGLAAAASAPVVAWQLHPHTSAFAWVGWLLLTAELSARERRLGRATIALALVTGATLAAGHLQTALHVALLVAAWVVVTADRVRREDGGGAAVLALARPAAGALLGLGLAAPHVLPFLHALRESSELADRAAGAGAVAPFSRLSLLLFPDLLGSPREGQGGGSPGYLELVPAYAGALVLCLAVLGQLCRPKPKERGLAGTFFAVGALALLVVFGVLDQALASVPPFHVTRNHRLVFLAGLAVAVLGAVGLDAAMRERDRDRRVFLGRTTWVATGLFLVTVLTLGVGDVLRDAWQPSPAGRPGRTIWFAIAVPLAAGFCGLALLRSGLPRRRVELGLVAVAALELLLFAADVAPGSGREERRPALPALERLRGERVLCLGNVMPPNLGLEYGLRPTRSYDALGSRFTQRRLQRLAPFQGPLRGAFRFDDGQADALGIRYVLTDDPLLVKNLRRGLSGWYAYQPIARGNPLRVGPEGLRHTFGLTDRVSVLALPEVRAAKPTELRLRLTDRQGRLLREARQRVEPGTHEVLFRFGVIGESGKMTRLRFELTGDVRIAHKAGSPTFLLADRISAPYELVSTPWRACWVLENPDARPRAQPIGPGQARVVGDGSVWVEVEVEGVTRLRLADAWAPGWTATCDGQPVVVEEVDGLREVDVPPGGKKIRFEYRAPGLRIGIALWLACLIVLGLVGVSSYRAGRGNPGPSR